MRNYFRRVGLTVSERDYGTRVYKRCSPSTMSTAILCRGRREPYSTGYGGIHAVEECHLRLVNAACYLDNAAAMMQNFIDTYGYTINRISRVDICLDFERFRRGRIDPQRSSLAIFVRCTAKSIKATSQSWCRPLERSSVEFRFMGLLPAIGPIYNKTMEYTIWEPWEFVPQAPHSLVEVWPYRRLPQGHEAGKGWMVHPSPQMAVEFSIRSSVKKWFAIELNGEERLPVIRNTR